MANSTEKNIDYQTFTEDEHYAAEIIGYEKIFSLYNSNQVWDHQKKDAEMIFFFDSTLEECAEENKHGADWRLVWINGFSLFDLYDMRKSNFNTSKNFHLSKAIKKHLLLSSLSPRYHLLDFSGRFADMTWQEQEGAIVKHDNHGRAPYQAVVEATIGIQVLFRRNILPYSYCSDLPCKDIYTNITDAYVAFTNYKGIYTVPFEKKQKSKKHAVVIECLL